MHRRIVLHGVDCVIEKGEVCREERPVLDEAVSELDPGAAVVIDTGVPDAMSANPSDGRLSAASIDAICEYLTDGGVEAQTLTVDEDGVLPDPDRDTDEPLIEVRVSHTVP